MSHNIPDVVSCAENFDLFNLPNINNADLKRIQNQCKKNNFKFHELSTTHAICLILILSSFALVQASKGAAVYSNVDFLTKPNFEPLCTSQQEHFVESNGKESSLILEFNSGSMFTEKRKSCTRILSAPPSYGFIVRLILPKIRRGNQNYHTSTLTATSTSVASVPATTLVIAPASAPALSPSQPPSSNMLLSNMKPTALKSTPTALNEMTELIEKLNATALKAVLERTCPLTIFSSLDPHTPQWRLDPCQLEDTAPEMEDPVRLFHGRIRIVWEHGSQLLHSKLMVTALGKGEQCRGEDKHQCLKIGDEPILCISKELICDGIRHCPYSPEYDSDEDYGMCWKRRHFSGSIPPAMESDIFEHFALEVFRNLFAFDAPTSPEEITPTKSPTAAMNALPAITTLRKVENVDADTLAKKLNETLTKFENSTESGDNMSGHGRRNSTRNGLGSDFSKYGPWGYLMLGMLLCGGALLICGLWASASQHAANNEREAALQNGAGGFSSNLDHTSGATSPPNYEELDPPPAYSVLFPNQKADSSTTLSSLAAAAMPVPVTTVLPATITNSYTNTTAANTDATTTAITPTTATLIPTIRVRSPSLTEIASSSSQYQRS